MKRKFFLSMKKINHQPNFKAPNLDDDGFSIGGL